MRKSRSVAWLLGCVMALAVPAVSWAEEDEDVVEDDDSTPPRSRVGVEAVIGVNVGGESFTPVGGLASYQFRVMDSFALTARVGFLIDDPLKWFPIWVGGKYYLNQGKIKPFIGGEFEYNLFRFDGSGDSATGAGLAVGADMGPITGRVGFNVSDLGRFDDSVLLMANVGFYFYSF